MAALLELSHELLHCIFVEVNPVDLSALCRTCHSLESYIKGNTLLHKELYSRRYDEPGGESGEPDWEDDIHQAVRLERILESEDMDLKREELGFVAKQIDRLLKTAYFDSDESNNVKVLLDHFQDNDESQANCDAFLCASSIWITGGTKDQLPASTYELRQASAKLHCLYGKPLEPVPTSRYTSTFTHIHFLNGISQIDLRLPPSANTRAGKDIAGHMVARAKVYDLREYTENSIWGPFKDDGTQFVDWEKVEAVMMVLGYNLNKFTERSDGNFPLVWEDRFAGATPGSYISPPVVTSPTKDMDEEISIIRELNPSIDSQDPYGVTGTWMRVVCFLDYNDLYAFNFSDRIPSHQARDPIDTEEGIIDLSEHVSNRDRRAQADVLRLVAIRLIRIKLQVSRIDPPGTGDEGEEDDGLDWSNFKGERLPVVHFRGISRSLHARWDPNANSRIRGSVRQTPEGEVRWTTWSIFGGEERWRSEGIQVGGVKSARGILGNWFDKDFAIHGPAGPTAFWKETDELEEERLDGTHVV